MTSENFLRRYSVIQNHIGNILEKNTSLGLIVLREGKLKATLTQIDLNFKGYFKIYSHKTQKGPRKQLINLVTSETVNIY